ncbi:MazG-like family protein [Streptomyces sp. NBC_00536]|uniref:MazG-like family protein n=1 Tax=Streptomyces sp. NBC_00536 TaxID=2975769 RepID=UPI002E8214DE|nr:MazG-like family protein [Streptomyces sp. NBC_00536]WUC83078.1 MazG-like family protein [Streptomyces sp. NBC_00536]
MDANTWDQINQIRAWLDDNTGHQTETERNLLRVLKIGEEFGEVSEALHGALSANPRKGRSHTWDDVRKELIDVAVTTFVALATLTPDAEQEFGDRLQHLIDRVTPSSPDLSGRE